MSSLDYYLDLIPKTLSKIDTAKNQIDFCNDPIASFLFTAYICKTQAKTSLETVGLSFDDLITGFIEDKDFIDEYLLDLPIATDDLFESLQLALKQLIELKKLTDYYSEFSA